MRSTVPYNYESGYQEVVNLPPSPPRMGWPARIFWIVLLDAVAIYGFFRQDYVLAAVPMVIMCAAFSGFRIGALRLVGSLGAIALAIAYAPQVGITYEVTFAQWLGTTGLMNRLISIGSVGLLVTAFCSIALMVLIGRPIARRPWLAWLNSWTGFAFAGVQGLVAAWLFLGGILMIDALQPKSDQGVDGDVASIAADLPQAVQMIAEHTKQSELGPWIEKYNPFVCIPQLNRLEEVQRTVQVLGDPARMNGLLLHPHVAALQQRPTTQRAIRELIADPGIRELLESESKIDKPAVMMLMKHPAVLNLVDQPGFLAAAQEAIRSGVAATSRPESLHTSSR